VEREGLRASLGSPGWHCACCTVPLASLIQGPRSLLRPHVRKLLSSPGSFCSLGLRGQQRRNPQGCEAGDVGAAQGSRR